VEEARAQVAGLLGARSEEIVFTSGATEANNLAIQGVARARRKRLGCGGVVTSTIEHKSVSMTMRALAEEGFALSCVGPDKDGRIHPEHVNLALREDTALVSIMSADGEIGAVQPVSEIGAICRERGILFHTDATQTAGRLPVDVEAIRCDLLSLSAHKCYGPKGAGALYIRSGVEVIPIIHGGGQERGLRSGTLNVPAIVGFGMTAALRLEEMAEDARRLRELVARLWRGIQEIVPDACLNGPAEERLPGNMNVVLPRIPAERLLPALNEFALSTGSACSSGGARVSEVLTAIGLDAEAASCSVRIGLGRSSTQDQVDQFVTALGAAARRLRPNLSRSSGTPVA
jgi:cysteine desulfurase